MIIQVWELLVVAGCVLVAMEMLTGTFVLLGLAVGCFTVAAAFELLLIRSGALLVLLFGISSAGSAYLLTRILGPSRRNRGSDVSQY